MGELSHHDLEELLGVYALDAVDDDERTEIEEHLTSCPRCRDELSAHREVAGLFAFAGQTAPAGLWDRITASMQETPPELRLDRIRASMVTPETLAAAGDQPTAPVITRLRPRGRRTIGTRVFVASVAAAAAVAAFVGVSVAHDSTSPAPPTVAVQQAPSSTATMADVRRALRQAGSRRVVLAPLCSSSACAGHGASLDAVVTPSGTSYLYDADLTPLGDDRTYQLWGVVGTKRISYALLSNDPTGVLRFQAGTGVQGLAVTNEVASGVTVSTQPVVVAGTVNPPL